MDEYCYVAEYVSQVNGEHFLNFDLGFRTWKVQAVTIQNVKKNKFKPGDRLWVKVYVEEKTRHKPHKYTCMVTPIL